MTIKSCNLSERNERIYHKQFKNRKGAFSHYINARINRDFTEDEGEHLMNVIRENSTKIEQLESINEKLQKKLSAHLDKLKK